MDPYVMCTGALAQVGFNTVIVVALDDYAGINWDRKSECKALDGTDSQVYVREHFAYPQVVGDLSREAFGKDFLACSWKPQNSPEEFISFIRKEHPGFNGVAYFDMFGNLLYLAEDDENTSSKSAFMNVTRKYAAVRNIEPIEGYEINEYLSNPKYGYFVYMTCPKISAKTIMEIGAIGSTLENTSEHPIVYINGEENEAVIETIIVQLPPLYNENINIQFEQIAKVNR